MCCGTYICSRNHLFRYGSPDKKALEAYILPAIAIAFGIGSLSAVSIFKNAGRLSFVSDVDIVVVDEEERTVCVIQNQKHTPIMQRSSNTSFNFKRRKKDRHRLIS